MTATTIGLAAAVIAVSQWFGLMHGYAHPPALPDAGHAHAEEHGHAHAETRPLAPWDDHDEGSAGCQLLDQLWHGDWLGAVAPSLAEYADLGREPPAPLSKPRPAGRCAAFWARAPPAPLG